MSKGITKGVHCKFVIALPLWFIIPESVECARGDQYGCGPDRAVQSAKDIHKKFIASDDLDSLALHYLADDPAGVSGVVKDCDKLIQSVRRDGNEQSA